jgi:hypothetical protein
MAALLLWPQGRHAARQRPGNRTKRLLIYLPIADLRSMIGAVNEYIDKKWGVSWHFILRSVPKRE